MITAKEAKKQAIFNSTLKEELGKIDKTINEAVAAGKFYCQYAKWGEFTADEERLILEKLDILGYKAEYNRNYQPGCPCDQMDPYSYLKISWED